ncbi:MAG: molybdopterin-dependent oxidoreductase [Alphaproteobacteria bacterium]|jgi:phenylacetyl-CoA:acceptor oxidoreductase|nr:molybdopterin oxidoreductase [Rhodospirillaceae bacterium]MDP6021526.1 molybdopterin-dependent oxidoreductase [Alphaproteobacteria bacterium]MDP7056371.1 molybdopterin-dependent oxidoreductase [Alphaproteobacteria bacterium]MDP7228407.1 molybdopterin-dependent oxidoreductase [Alphaproteobacteria bacterium]MDP7460769.1 molybdopterin-dependent oxidoreductase [Alphaproteobacteria bacterium]|tara:strand:- start:659 stop:3379 length:2721 start_codon:yes stop_codon:yes gene_type:complete
MTTSRKVPQYCYQCVAGPDFLTVKVEDGVATEVEPNFALADVHPGAGKACVKAYGLVQKTYNPNRLLTPMKRTNPKKGRDEDPGFVPISWDEALDLVGGKLNEIKAKGQRDELGYPRVAASFGGGGSPTYYMGSFPAFLSAWGAVDFSFGSGQGVKCTHSEHLYGELWHRAFTVASDTPTTNYILSFGGNPEASGGVMGVTRHANARERGVKRVQIEPHLSVTGACSAEWVPIRPKTDPAFMYGLMHVMLHEMPRERLDLEFLTDHTGSPYLVAPNGYFLRDPISHKPLMWDTRTGAALPFDTDGVVPALEGSFTASGIEVGADDEEWRHEDVQVETAFSALVKQMAQYTPEWAEDICQVADGCIRRIADEYVSHAQIGATTVIDGETLPLRPVSVVLGKTVNNGWGGYECCWGRTLLACLVGALEVPGGTLGTTVRLNRPATTRQASVIGGPDGFMQFPMNPTDKDGWHETPSVRNAHDTLVPLSANSPWSQALGPTHLAWMFRKESPENWPEVSAPDLWFVYRTNPAISFWDTKSVTERISEFPFIVSFCYIRDETNHMADVLLPERTDFESTQLIRVGGTKFSEAYWDHEGVALRQPAIEPLGDTMDFTDIATALAERAGILENYNNAINRGAAGVPLKGSNYDFSLNTVQNHATESIWQAMCQAASAELTGGAESDGLDWYKEHGIRTKPISRLIWYLFPEMRKKGLRFEMPYQEQLYRIGKQLGNRLHEKGIEWWNEQLKEYEALPPWKDFPGIWEQATVNSGGDLDEYPFWLLTSRSMQLAWGANSSIQMIDEVAKNMRGHRAVVMNAGRAVEMGIEDGDLVEIKSTLRGTKGRVVLKQGIRPDTILIQGQFDHWVTPYSVDHPAPSMNTVVPMSLALTDSTGSSADIVRVAVNRLEDRA